MIIFYHHVAPPERAHAAGGVGWGCNHSPDEFEHQLIKLRRLGRRFIPLAELVAKLGNGEPEPDDCVVVTFDDGWMDTYDFAVPILKRLGVPATFFVITDHLRRGVRDAQRMGAAELRQLVKEGFTVGTHTRTHLDLTRVTPETAREEIAGCKADVEQTLGLRVDCFAYPGGAFNQRVARLTQEVGYKAACSILGPKANDNRSLFWLFRDLLSPGMNRLGDYYRLSRLARRLLAFRVNRRLNAQLRS